MIGLSKIKGVDIKLINATVNFRSLLVLNLNQFLCHTCTVRYMETKAQSLYAACLSFEHIVAFSLLFNGLEPPKPLVVKLQKPNQEILKGYCMIDAIVSNIMDYRRNIGQEFSI